jgi:perosamine synthetase
VAEMYASRLGQIPEVVLPCADRGAEQRSWFVYVVQLPPRVDRDAVIAELRQRAIDSKPYLPAIHLQPYMRERFGFAPGDFPVCEEVSARSLALPFYPALTERAVDRVCTELTRLIAELPRRPGRSQA